MPKLKPNHVSPTPEENARILAAIAADPETFELDEAWFARARPAAEVVPHIVERYLKFRASPEGRKYFPDDGSAPPDAEPSTPAAALEPEPQPHHQPAPIQR